MPNIQELTDYLDNTRKNLETYHSEENCDMFMEEILEYAMDNWINRDSGDPKLTEEQWDEARNKFIDRKYKK